jgi:hypothetical protein
VIRRIFPYGHCLILAGLILTLSWMSPLTGWADPGGETTISVTTTRAIVSPNQQIEVRVEAKGTFSKILKPTLTNFSLVSQRREGSSGFSISFGGGRTRQTRSKSYALVLKPLRTGKLSLGPFRLEYNGKIVAKSAPLNIHVLSQNQISKRAPQISMKLNRSRISIEERALLTVTVSGGNLSGLRLRPPTSRFFELTERKGKKSSGAKKDAQGRYMETATFNYVVRPNRVGTYALQGAEISKQRQSIVVAKPLTLKVTAPKPKPAVTSEANRALKRHIGQPYFIHASIPRNSYYVGEPFIITWRLFYDQYSSIWNAQIESTPQLKGLLVQDLNIESGAKKSRLVGSQMMAFKAVDHRIARGLSPGIITIDPMILKIQAAGAENFGMRWRKVASDPFTLEIKPLPKKGQPADFNEAVVGQFQMNVSLADEHGQIPKTMKTGRRAILDISITGIGNLVGLKAPRVVDTSGSFTIESFPSENEDQILQDRTGVHGKRAFKFLIVPQKPGNMVSPDVVFDYFDPVRESYKSLKTKGRLIEITGSPIVGSTDSSGRSQQDIGPILPNVTLSHHDKGHFAGTSLFWLLALCPLGFLLMVEGGWRYRQFVGRNPELRRAKGALGKARKGLLEAQSLMDSADVKGFFGQITRIIIGFFEDKAGFPATGMTHDILRTTASGAGFDSKLLDDVIAELENADFARFAPAATLQTQMKETLKRIQAMVEELDRSPVRRSS